MRLSCLAAAAACLLCGSASAAPLRPYTVADSIALSGFLSPAIQYYQATPRIVASPDRSKYLAVTLRGDLASGRRIASLLVFDAAAIRHALASGGPAPAPKTVATWASASNLDPVSGWRWSSDGRQVFFIGADDEGVQALYAAELATGQVRRLSPEGQDVPAFDEAAGQIVYLAQPPMPEDEANRASGPGIADAVVGTGANGLTTLFPRALSVMLHDAAGDLWAIGEDNKPHPVLDPASHQPIQLKQARLKLSPDGRRLLTTVFAQVVPKDWERYRPVHLYPGLSFVADTPGVPVKDSLYRPRQYAVVDLQSGRLTRLADAPVEIETQFRDAWAAWSPDGSAVAVVGLYPKLSDDGGAGVLPCDVAVVRLTQPAYACARPAKAREDGEGFSKVPAIIDLGLSSPDELSITLAKTSTPDQRTVMRYERRGGAWRASGPSKAPAEDLRVRVVEDLRHPPTVVAARQGRERTVYDPNAYLAGVEMAEVVDYAWRTPDGVEWTGALVKPPGFKPGVRYPLVIQTHNLDRTRFLADGPSAAGFAARALAARGIMVLQVDEPGTGSGTPKESPAGAAGYRAAIAQLAAEGLVDPKRVGITAWSHMGPYVMQGLVEDPGQYAAAIFADSAYNSYQEYLMNIDYMDAAREAMSRAQVGPKPFGAGLKVWMDTSAGFMTDRVCTPTFWQFYGPPSLVYGWSSYAALRAQDKPLEFLYFRTGEHSLRKPAQRLLGQGMSVDWYDFWLNGHKDPSPQKAAQYARWDLLRASPACGDAGEAPSKGR